MSHGAKKILGVTVVALVLTYLGFFLGSYLFYTVGMVKHMVSPDSFPLKSVMGWFTVGVSLALLASLTAWPFALAISTLLEHNRSRSLTHYFLQLLSYVASLPLILFVYVYLAAVGVAGFDFFKSLWVFLFASPNFFTQALAFALTLLLYPLAFAMDWGSSSTIDSFYRNMLATVIEFAEVGLVATLMAVGLFLYVLPKMILHMRKLLMDDENQRSTEIIQSVGGTPWESIHLTVMQAMKTRFNDIILHFTKLCFFEGLITFALLQAFFLESGQKENHWSSTLSTLFFQKASTPPFASDTLLAIAGLLTSVYVMFSLTEWFQRRSAEVQNG